MGVNMDEQGTNIGVYEHFVEICKNASDVQRKLLKKLIAENKDAEYVRDKKIFNNTVEESVSKYSKNVPLSGYSDYSPYINRLLLGESNLLFNAPVEFYNISSGTTGEIKYIPLTKEDIELHHKYVDLAVNEIICKHIPHKNEDEIFGCIFNLNDFFKTWMGSVPSGVRSGTYYWYTKSHGDFDVSRYTVPAEVFFPDEIEDMLYVRVRFALSNPDVTAIFGIFTHRAVSIFRYIEQNWKTLIDDIRNGTVNDCFGVSDKWKEYIINKLPPDKERAAWLDSIPYEDLSKGMLLKIWNKLKVIRVIDGDTFYLYSDKLKEYAKGVSIHGFAYASSEGVIGINVDMNGNNEYVLIPDCCYYEFIPENSIDEKKTLTIDEVKAGERYELIITTPSGFWRYHTGDIVEVTGFMYNSPKIRVCYRKELVLSMFDESVTNEQLTTAFDIIIKEYGIGIKEFCVRGDSDSYPGNYCFYVEKEPDCDCTLSTEMAKRLDSALCEINVGYKMVRSLNDLDPVRIFEVMPGTFNEYDESALKNGRRCEQGKPVRIITKKEQIEYISSKVIREV